jgi:hypothetical protein
MEKYTYSAATIEREHIQALKDRGVLFAGNSTDRWIEVPEDVEQSDWFKRFVQNYYPQTMRKMS